MAVGISMDKALETTKMQGEGKEGFINADASVFLKFQILVKGHAVSDLYKNDTVCVCVCVCEKERVCVCVWGLVLMSVCSALISSATDLLLRPKTLAAP